MKYTKDQISNEEFTILINENRLKIYKTAMAILKNEDDANDAIQDTLLSAYRNIDKLNHKEYFVTWIITILRNKCFDIIKKNKKVINLDYDTLENTEKYYDTYKEESAVEMAINKLEKELKEITVLYYYDELSVKDIANMIKIPEGTVKSRLSRIRGILKEYIEEEEGGVE